MKLNDFRAGSSTANNEKLRRFSRNKTIRFTNETKEAAYQAEINNLTQKVLDVEKLSAELGSAKIQRSQALEVKKQTEEALNVLSAKFKTVQTSFEEYEKREPRIKQIIEQHRELNGQVAELQTKLQMVIEQHDEKVDLVNDKIQEISNLKDSLGKAELSNTKATQASLEANMKKDALQVKVEQETKKNARLSIIYQEEKEARVSANQERNQFEVDTVNANLERDTANRAAQRFKVSSENLSEQIKELAENYYEISQVNKMLIEELKKPRYASVASISRHEGFKFPTSFEARKNTLGTGKPTLLRKKD
tara:strand:- start:1363 stop:2286 length:924 start_codon:yes stop_codon:yes gene_type:complete